MAWNGKDRREESPGRRDCDRGVCGLHHLIMDNHKAEAGRTVEKIKTLFGLVDGMVPRWVFLWIGGPTVGLILVFTGWTAVKSITTSERVVKLEIVQESLLENQKKMMEHFDIKPVAVKAKQ